MTTIGSLRILAALVLFISGCCKSDCDCQGGQACQLGFCRAGAQPHNACPNGGPCAVGLECTSKVCAGGVCVATAPPDPCDNGTGVGLHGSTCLPRSGCGVGNTIGPNGANVICLSGTARGPLNANKCDAVQNCWVFGNPPKLDPTGKVYMCSNGSAAGYGPNYP